MIRIEEYSFSDKTTLVRYMEALQDYLVALDPLKLLRRDASYGKEYTKLLLDKISNYSGRIYIAREDGNEPVGLIAGIIEKESKEVQISVVLPSKRGRVIELFVDEKYRSKGVGKMLMQKMEDYFKALGCDMARIEVFQPNENAHQFYKKFGYQGRLIDLIKLLR